MTGRRQPQRIPPPIDYGSERIEAELVLREYPGDMGLVLWKTVRSVCLWAGLTREARARAFQPRAYERRMALLASAVPDAGVRGDLEITALVLRDGAVTVEEVGEACARISDWATADESTGTALQFIQAAALALPTDATLAYRTARIAVQRSEHGRAETWCRHTLVVARATRDWQRFSSALLSLGVIYQARGNLPLARRLMHRAVRVAKRHSLREMLGYSYLALLGVALPTRPRELDAYARGAMAAFGPGHAGLASVAHVLAMQWLDAGFYGPAQTLLQRLPPDFGDLAVRDEIALNAATAAAALQRDAGREYPAGVEKLAADLSAAMGPDRAGGD